ncbi:MAG: hypothetical protein FWH12_06910 [Treponema sp.]|nr:hypothetical protein [Treponema sp.]
MLSREDFIFTIGYDGPAAVVDNQAKRRYAKLSTRELAERGLFRAAYSSALYSRNTGELQSVIEAYNHLGSSSPDFTPIELNEADLAKFNSPGEGPEESAITPLDRLFGVFLVDVKRTISL